MQPEVLYQVTEEQFNEIREWLREEDNASNEGFFCNIHLIEKSYQNEEIAIITLQNKVVGFITWWQDQPIRTIEIVEVHPEHRNKGLARTLLNSLERKSKEEGTIVFDLQCSPASSEIIWKRLGFIEFPLVPDWWHFNGGNKQLYKILSPTLPVSKTSPQNNTCKLLELWNEDQYRVREQSPTWIWDLSNQTGKFPQPIVSPGSPDWKIRYSDSGSIVFEGRVKWFSKNQIDFGKIIVIKEIPPEFEKS